MVDIGAIGAMVSALNGAITITKGMVDLRDAAAFQSKVIDLQRAILEAQASAFAAQSERSDLLDQMAALKAEIQRLLDWETERARYALSEVGSPGAGSVLVYAVREDRKGDEPFHQLCANCFEQGRKSIIQATQELRARRRVHVCPQCKAEFTFGHVPVPPPAQTATLRSPIRGR